MKCFPFSFPRSRPIPAILLAVLFGGISFQGWNWDAKGESIPPGMVRIEGGEFEMGSNATYSLVNERPAHRVSVESFFLDKNAVTNQEFAAFVAATGYVTLAERPVDWEELKKQAPPGTPKPPDSALQPGSLVFQATRGPVDLRRMDQWWTWTTGANWKNPEGPDSSIEGREQHPVVQVAWEDAVAYADWAGKRLPTEAEWEFAAKGGLEGKRFGWGDDESPSGEWRANRWTGDFPYRNNGEDGHVGTAPVASYPPNAFGLYDMGGNVWNWTADVYHGGTYLARTEGVCCDPAGPAPDDIERELPGDPSPATAPGVLRRVIKGGSFLCSPTYCESYRPSARRGTPPDTSSSHVGFRCAKSIENKPD